MLLDTPQQQRGSLRVATAANLANVNPAVEALLKPRNTSSRYNENRESAVFQIQVQDLSYR